MILFCFTLMLSTPTWAQVKFTQADYDLMYKQVQTFSIKTKLTKADLPEVIVNLKKVIIMDDGDESSSASGIISNSYLNNKSLYKQALKSFNKADQKTLKEIFDFIEYLNKNGNG